jgi:hypothetical protein
MISAKRGNGVDISRPVDPEFESDDEFSLKMLEPEEFSAILMSMGGAIRQQVLNNDGDEYDDINEHHWPVKVWKNMILF